MKNLIKSLLNSARINRLEAEVEALAKKLRVAQAAQSAQDVKISALKTAHPAVWEKYFSRKSKNG